MLKMKLKGKNKNKTKIIFIYGRNYKTFFPDTKGEQYYLAGHSGYIARKLVENFPRYEIENWRMDLFAKKVEKKNTQNVLCKVYPSFKIPVFTELSLKFLIDLKIESIKNQVIIHHSHIYVKRLFLLKILFPTIPFVASHFGGKPPIVKNKKDLKSKILISMNKFAHKNINNFFMASQSAINDLRRISGVDKDKIQFPEIGTDVSMFTNINKIAARNELNMPVDHKILLFIGRFNEEKGLDIILNILPKLVAKFNNKVTLVLIGGSEKDKLFDLVQRNKNIKYYFHTDYDRLPFFHNAADVFVKPSFNNIGADSVGANVIETLCCGTPVCSPNLSELPIKGNYGEIPKDEDDFLFKVIKILENPEKYMNFNSSIRNLYSWESYTKKIDNVYSRILNENS